MSEILIFKKRKRTKKRTVIKTKSKKVNSCCKHTQKDKVCIRKDGKQFSLPRRFSKKKCKNPRGFTMRSSCAPYKGCKS